jgi:hypothetical protein
MSTWRALEGIFLGHDTITREATLLRQLVEKSSGYSSQEREWEREEFGGCTSGAMMTMMRAVSGRSSRMVWRRSRCQGGAT